MSKTYDYNRLLALGISWDHAQRLRRISMTLQRWHELECGDGNPHGSWAIERDDNGDGPPFLVHHHSRGTTRTPIPDREAGAKKRLAKILANYPDLTAYIQTDPRGAALYVLRTADIPAGADLSSCYSSCGIAVYK